MDGADAFKHPIVLLAITELFLEAVKASQLLVKGHTFLR